MEKNYIVDKNRGLDRVLAGRCEDFLRGCFEMRDKGYTLRTGEVFASLAGYQAFFDAPDNGEASEERKVEPVKITGTLNMNIDEASAAPEPDNSTLEEAIKVSVVDLDKIQAMKGDKKSLDEYAETLGVKLNRSKSFKNMLKDLEKGLKA